MAIHSDGLATLLVIHGNIVHSIVTCFGTYPGQCSSDYIFKTFLFDLVLSTFLISGKNWCMVVPYSGKYLWDKIFADFAVCLTSAKILSVN